MLLIVFWALIVVAGLFKLRVYLESQMPPEMLAVSKNAEPPRSDSTAPREFDDFLLRLIRTWDYEEFQEAVDPSLRAGIPYDGLKTLFQGLAYRLGPLVYYKGSQPAEESLKNPASGRQIMRAEAVFMKGEAVLEVEILKMQNRLFIRSFSVDSTALQGVEAAAQEAYQSGRMNAALFRQKIAS